MDDISEKLSELLNNPEALRQAREIAEGILAEEPREPSSEPNTDDISGLLGSDAIPLLISVISRLKKADNDPRAQLLTALKPNLSEARRERVDTAIKILKAIELLPLIKDSGLFKL